MDYSQFFNMIPEASLMAILVIVFLADLILKGEKKHTTLSLLTGILLIAQMGVCFTASPAEAFSGLYVATAAATVMKVILTAGAFIVMVMAQSWLERADVKNKEGEFYELLVSTLLGMYVMISSGHFLMFFLGLEMASVPMACLVAFDKFKQNSAEGAAKFILTATFSSFREPLAHSILMMWQPRLQLLRSLSWDWCSSSAVWASRFPLCLSTSGQPTPTRALLQPSQAI